MQRDKKKQPCLKVVFKRMKGVEPSSSAWKAEIISRYMTSALLMLLIYNFRKKMSIINLIFLRIFIKKNNELSFLIHILNSLWYNF